jgi:hypothetical protein
MIRLFRLYGFDLGPIGVEGSAAGFLISSDLDMIFALAGELTQLERFLSGFGDGFCHSFAEVALLAVHDLVTGDISR